MNSQDWGENEDRLEITSQDKAKHGHGKQADGSVLWKNTLSQSLEEIPRFAVPLLPVITMKPSGEGRYIFFKFWAKHGTTYLCYQVLCRGAEDSKQWMKYVAVINSEAVAGHCLVMFILETGRSIEEEELWEEKCCL